MIPPTPRRRPPEPVVRIALGEDNYLVREGITRALEGVEGFELVAVGEDLDSLRESVERLQPDVVVAGVQLRPTRTDEGIRLAVELRQAHPEMGVVLLSENADADAARMLFAGGSDRRAYILRDGLRDRDDLQRTIRDIAAGGSRIDSHVVETLLDDDPHRDGHLDKLTERERETLKLIAEGRSNSAIAEQLKITRRAVERHTNAIFLKLELGESDDVNRRVKAALIYLSSAPE